MKRHIRSFVIAATVSLAVLPAVAGCVVAPGWHHGWGWHDHRGHR